MSRPVAALSVALAVPVLAGGAPRLKTPNKNLPVGQWRVEFANGVVETCVIRDDGTAAVDEPKRSSPGKWKVRDGAVVIVSDDDRVERWKKAKDQWVVEHWCPSAAFPDGTPVVGRAKRR